ncbi:MAG TPA: SusC/RagA family TonB-linked outer membrane protein, partial [Chryseosolibacter sp.]|nr:SusC/RagA family TonB-linked outer membrane protein [Chryseosolibacter sp.]
MQTRRQPYLSPRVFPRSSTLVLTGVLALQVFLLQAQSLTVTGTILDDQVPLPGVSIYEKGTSTGTVSDAQGKFSLVVSDPQAILVCSFIGYKTVELQVGNRSELVIVMEADIQSLDEVVVTALGVQREVKSLGYAVQKVEGKDLTKAREPNVINALTGRVAGLEIRNSTDMFQDPGIRMRGAKPLLVIDGVPSVDADLWKINADDIENFSILKGATASALYGSIGRNGAIMITTKRASQGPSVEINSSTMFQPSFIRIPDVQSTYGNGNNGRYAYVDGSGSGLEGGGWIWGPRLDEPDPSTPSGFWETTQFNSPVDQDGNLIPLPFLSRGKDNVRNFFETGLISTNHFSVSGGNESGNFRVSASHVYQKGIVPNTALNNTSFGVSGGFKVAKSLRADASITYNRQYTDNFPEVGYGPSNYLYNLILWTGPDVDVRDLRNYWTKGKEGVQQRHFNNSWYNNPFFTANEYLRGYYKDNVFGQVKFDYSITKDVQATMRTGINQYALHRTWKEPKSMVRYNDISRGDLTLLGQNELNFNTDVLVSYKKELRDNISFQMTAGGANRWRTFRTNSQSTDGLVIPGFYNLSNSEKPLRGSGHIEEEKVNSVYGTLDVEFFKGIFLGVTGRNDWVSTLPVKNNSFFYPSVALSGVVSDFADLTTAKISFLKVRSSWSRVSDGRIRALGTSYPYQHIQAYSPGVNWNNTPSLTVPGTLINPDIHPETSDTYEVGLDVRFLDGTIGLDAAVYRIEDSNNIITVPVSAASGYTSLLENGGEYSRKGIELTLTATPVKSDALSWGITVNWSTYKRYLESVYDGSGKLGNIKVGTRTDQVFNWPYLRTPGGKLILRSNGFPQSDPYQRFIGYSNPDWIYGIQNAVQYRNFSVAVSIDGRVGGLMYSTTNQKMWWGGTHPGTVNQYRDDANAGRATYVAHGVVVVEGAVEYDEEGNIVDDTRVYAPNTTPVNYITWNINTSNAHLSHYYDPTFLKLREVTVTYRLPSQWLSKTFLRAASASVIGRNLMLWSDLPE